MTSIFEKFEELDLNKIRAEANHSLNQAKVKEGQFEKPPVGKYEVKIERMGIKPSKKNNPMFFTWFKILNGRFEGSRLFMNQSLSPSAKFSVGQRIGLVNHFLKSLDSSIAIDFQNFYQWEKMIKDVFADIDGRLEYCIDYSMTKNGFPKYKIVEVYDAF